jgi:hypothetical protein
VSAERRNVPAVIEAAAPVKTSSLRSTLAIPAAIADAGEHAARRFLEFFAANIRNKNTRMAYYRAVCSPGSSRAPASCRAARRAWARAPHAPG